MRQTQWACLFLTLGAVTVRLGSIALAHPEASPQQLLIEYWIDYCVSVASLGLQAILLKLSEQ